MGIICSNTNNNLMKTSFVLALFLGAISARVHISNYDVPGVTFLQQAADSESDSDSDEEAEVQTGDVFHPFDKGALGGAEYTRVIPATGGDPFLESVYSNYALEGKDADTGKPTGVFTLDETQAKALATEVLGTHKNLSGANLQAYLDTYWAKAWGHFDVNKGGSISASRAAELMRFLASDQYFQF